MAKKSKGKLKKWQWVVKGVADKCSDRPELQQRIRDLISRQDDPLFIGYRLHDLMEEYFKGGANCGTTADTDGDYQTPETACQSFDPQG